MFDEIVQVDTYEPQIQLLVKEKQVFIKIQEELQKKNTEQIDQACQIELTPQSSQKSVQDSQIINSFNNVIMQPESSKKSVQINEIVEICEIKQTKSNKSSYYGDSSSCMLGMKANDYEGYHYIPNVPNTQTFC